MGNNKKDLTQKINNHSILKANNNKTEPYEAPNDNEREIIKQKREDKKNEQIDFLANETILELSDKVKAIFVDIFGEDKDNIKLKMHIREFLLEKNPDFRGNAEKIDLPLSKCIEDEQYKYNRLILTQKRRWVKNAKESLNDKTKLAYSVFTSMYPPDLQTEANYKKFKEKKEYELQAWLITGAMTDFPFFESLYTKKSKLCAIKYDIGSAALNSLMLLVTSIIHRQPEYLTKSYVFSKPTRKQEKVELIKNKNEIIVSQKKKDTTIVPEQMSLLDYISIHSDDPSKEYTKTIDNLLSQFDKYKDSEIVKKIIKETLSYMSAFNAKDSEVFSYILSQISEQFYLYREISIVEKDALEALGKNPDQTRHREWFRKTCNKLRLKQIPIMKEDGDNIEITYPTLFQNISYKKVKAGKTKRNYNVIVLTASEVLHNLILKQDTINVYNDDYRKVRDSKYPNSALLIFQLQLIRIQLYKLNETTFTLSRSFLVKHLNLEDKSLAESITEIVNSLDVYVESNVFIKSYSFIEKYDEFELEFIPFKPRDLALLVNSRRDYSSIAESNLKLLTIP